MPFTPYHFGPNGFVGLLFRRWIDVPICIAANVLIDVEVIADSGIPWYFETGQPEWWFTGLDPGWPVHQLWHFHTLLIGGLAGAIFGAVVYYIKPLRWCSETFMRLMRLPGKASALSMIRAGLLGAWLHVLIDSLYHYDVQIFWPYRDNTLFRWINSGKWSNMRDTQQAVMFICIVFWGLMAALYSVLMVLRVKKGKNTAHPG